MVPQRTIAFPQSAPHDLSLPWLVLVSTNRTVYRNQFKTKMRAPSIIVIALLFGANLLSTSCKKDDPTPAAGLSMATLEGSWAISSGEGTEWEEGVGIITPRAADGSLVGLKIVIEDDMISVKDISGTVLLGPISFTLNTTTGVITAGNGATGLGVYTIKNFVAGASMEWDQREPIAEDYEAEAGCGCNLAFQKFLVFARL